MTLVKNPNTPGSRRRRTAALAIAVSAGLVAAACSSDGGSTAPATPGTTERAAAEEHARTQGFPVTVEHMSGSATIASKPTRVATLGYTDTDIANALGAEIVIAVASPFGDDGTNPAWAPSHLSAEVASLSAVEPSLEAIAAARPDVILATGAYPGTIEMYDQLSQIAPVVAPLTGPLLDSAADLTEVIGRVLGEVDAADALLEETDDEIAAFRAENPALDGRSVVFAAREGDQTALFVEPTAASVALLGELGLHTPDELLDLPGSRTFGAAFISDENLGLLDTADIAIVGLYTDESATEFLAFPTVEGLRVVQDDALIEIGRPLGAALQSPNPVSIGYVLEQLGPQLAAAAR